MDLNKWIPIHREDFDTYFLDTGAQVPGIYMWLLSMARPEVRTVWLSNEKLTLQPGDVVTSLRDMKKRWRSHHQTLTRTLTVLEQRGLIERLSTEPLLLRITQYQKNVLGSVRKDTQKSPLIKAKEEVVEPVEETSLSLTGKEEKLKSEHSEATQAPPLVNQPAVGLTPDIFNKVVKSSPKQTSKKEPAKKLKPLPTKKLVDIWNEHSGDLPKVGAFTTARQTKARLLLKQNDDLAYWKAVVLRIAASKFCRGDNERNWIATFDFFLRPNTHVKAMEGIYDNRTPLKGPVRLAKNDYDKENDAFVKDQLDGDISNLF